MCFECDAGYDSRSDCRKTNKRKYFVYCKIISKNGRVLAVSSNSYIKTAPLQAKWAKKCGLPLKQHVHAEVGAIAKLRPDMRKKAYAIYIYRFDHHGRPALAKPCKVCQALLKEVGIKHIFYTTPEDNLDMSYDKYKRYNKKYMKRWCHEDCL